MNVATRVSVYLAPPTEWRTIELMPTNAQKSGTGTAPTTRPGRQSMCSRLFSRPQAVAIWSIMPHGAPTMRFSTVWHIAASFIPGTSMSSAPATALIAATSMAADELTPAPRGTSDVMAMFKPPSKRV